jgi:hypothetical protein
MSELATIQSAFSRGRRRDAGGAALAAALVVGLGVVASRSVWDSAPYALIVVLEVLLFVALGGVGGRRALSAVLLGTVPLSTALLSTLVGHACTPSGCVSLCAPFCAAGGIAAGGLLSRMCWKSPRPLLSWLVGATLIVSTGAIGCACVGAAGIAGMCAGVGLSSLLWAARVVLPRRGT